MRRSTSPHPVLALVGLGCLLPGLCSGCIPVRGCTPSIELGIVVRVTNAQTDEGIVDAVLTLTEGGYSEILAPPGSALGSYAGASERPGTYTLTVEATGFVSQTITDIVVKAGPCHVETVGLTVSLTPTG